MQPLVMTPAPGERLVRFVGDQISFSLAPAGSSALPAGWQARLRTNLGRGERLRQEILHGHGAGPRLADASWRDVPMTDADGRWSASFSLTEPGFFKAKAYALDPDGRQHWPDGPDFGVSVHPDGCRTANTIYCAFPRMFGESKAAVTTANAQLEHMLAALDQDGYTVIPSSGKLRDLIRELPHIVDTLGCRILHLLPVNPTPTVYARFGRFGSPYACQDLLAIDPALVEFDRRTTGVDQFRELAYAVHARGARLLLDVVINHTGWGSTLQENHPEWYMRDKDGAFVCPGAWNVVWEDLSELDHRNRALWEHLGDVFLEWCRRGVDGFRCDAGYKIPAPAWRYITARVQQEFPDTVFLLEGLGGPWEATETLLTEGGMQWCYSELFQNYSAVDVARYLDHALRQSRRLGLYVHYSETHDNNRLAAEGRAWSLLRNRLCALTSVSGAFGFTCGVEWMAPEKIQVHQSRGLAWGNADNLVAELAALNRLLAHHPCFFDDATITRLSAEDDAVLAIRRVSSEGLDSLLALFNTDLKQPQDCLLLANAMETPGPAAVDLLGQTPPGPEATDDGRIRFRIPPGGVFCLAASAEPRGLSGERYREERAQAAWAITLMARRVRVRDISPFDWRRLAALVQAGPSAFLAAVSRLDPDRAKEDVLAALEEAATMSGYPPVAVWTLPSRRRSTVVPQDHWLLIEDVAPFRASLKTPGGVTPQHAVSLRVGGTHYACFVPGQPAGDATLALERYTENDPRVSAALRFVELPGAPAAPNLATLADNALALLTNGRGGMARLAADLGRVFSKYDCLLAANLHPEVPVDRHVFAKRVRAWVNADGFIAPLNAESLVEFEPGPPARWRFVAGAGDDRAVEIRLTADLLDGRNTTVLRFERPAGTPPQGHDLPPEARVTLIVRVDIEDRNFHTETHHNGGAEHHFHTHTRRLDDAIGFEFRPARDRQLRVTSDGGVYHAHVEWCHAVPHPVEGTRGQVEHGDAFSPGWFEVPLEKGRLAFLTFCADPHPPTPGERAGFDAARVTLNQRAVQRAALPEGDAFGRRLALAVQAFVARRGAGRTVIAGYPWFLDWGRDSLICARGLLAAGLKEEVRQLLEVFARFEEKGTLPNIIHGEDASNRDTSDAPLWFGVVCEEAARADSALYGAAVDAHGRTVLEVLHSIAACYRDGTPNGIVMDPDSALIWSPSHFTWMDTNHPTGTPREGYPVEIQALWIRLLQQLDRLGDKAPGESWGSLAERARHSLVKYFWLEEQGWLADLLAAPRSQPARHAEIDDALRSNGLFAISLGLLDSKRARRCVDAALRHLVVPGALRSLAPLPARRPLPVRAPDGRLLNDPAAPYWGRYEGEEDTLRKPAYHNGTAWTWTLPTFCEALAGAWDFAPEAVRAARHYLAGMERLLDEGCLGQLPEIVDGDAPHAQRGCDAQAWGATEALRVWKLLAESPGNVNRKS